MVVVLFDIHSVRTCCSVNMLPKVGVIIMYCIYLSQQNFCIRSGFLYITTVLPAQIVYNLTFAYQTLKYLVERFLAWVFFFLPRTFSLCSKHKHKMLLLRIILPQFLVISVL